MQPRIVNRLTLPALLLASYSNNPIYTMQEYFFLGQHAPYSFLGRSLDEGIDDAMAFDLTLKLFKNIVTLDSTVIKGGNIKDTPKEKAEKLNPIFDAFGLQKVIPADDKLRTLYEIKQQGLEVLLLLQGNRPFTPVHHVGNPNGYEELVEHLIREVGDNPIFLAGSSVKNPQKPNDFDTRIIIPSWEPEIYKMYHAKKPKLGDVPIDFVFIPRKYLNAFLLSDIGYMMHPFRMIHGEIDLPMPSRDHIASLAYASAAASLITLREASTKEGIEECRGILARIQARTKLPGFIYDHLGIVWEHDSTRPEAIRYGSMPSDKRMRWDFAKANMQAHDVMKRYIS